MRTLGNSMKRIAIGGASLLAAATFLVVGAPTAQAHLACAAAHRDGSYACINTDHTYIFVCDQDVDGNYAYARTYRNGVVQPPLYDQNGAASGCSFYAARVASLDSINICVQNEGCGPDPLYRNEF